MFKYTCNQNDQGRTLYKISLKIFPNLPISKIEKMFRSKEIKVNNVRTNDKKMILQENDEIIFYCHYEQQPNIQKVNNNFDILQIIYEDQNILIVNKPNDISMHGFKNCLDFQVLEYLKVDPKLTFKPSHIGRLDKETSGLVVYAKNYSTLRFLQENKSFEKTYILKNDFPLPFNKEIKNRILIQDNQKSVLVYPIDSNFGKEASTIFFSQNSTVYAQIITGRKHQIRATAAWLGYPIYGDTKYNGISSNRLYLHCFKLKFNQNINNQELNYLSNKEFQAEPKDWN
ncbi:pseudouridine synthase [Mycoplasmopsis hyopharyngis]|uniref:pseudouridine synthase n=1 Tax=Mycoplasmopsis hyopharyngis TaxID=29558 RepID=UPI003872E70A